MPVPFSLSAVQRATFERVGVLHLPGFYAAADTEQMASRLWADLARRYAIDRQRPETWTTRRPAQFQGVERSGAFNLLASPELGALADQLLGAGSWDRPKRWGQPLVTFPAAQWDLRRVMWHLDYPANPEDTRLHALRVFVLLEPVLPQGGGTLYVAGSHRLAAAIATREGRSVASADMRERLKMEHPWFAKLWATPGDDVRALLRDRVSLHGVDIAIGEMTGAAGDLYVMHPTMLHGASHNALNRPRMMLVQSLNRRGAA